VTEWTKWRPQEQASLLGSYIDLSATGPNGLRSGLTGITVLIWPESPFSFLLAREPWALSSIAELLRMGPTTLVTGAVRAEPPEGSETRPRFYNSIYIMGSDGEIKSAYDKFHLVPFGEYLPLQPLFDLIGFSQLTQIKSAFSRGPGPRTLPVPGAPPAGMTICYEAVFPGAVIDPGNRPGWIVNVTNDSWFGMSPGPYQHLDQARMRAVEEGLPVVRDANSGISAVIDAYGRITGSIALGKVGTLDSDLPAAIDPPFYATIRDAGVLVELTLTSLFTLWANLRRKRLAR
jgi:apolipoprotein N-acyltransferase